MNCHFQTNLAKTDNIKTEKLLENRVKVLKVPSTCNSVNFEISGRNLRDMNRKPQLLDPIEQGL